jgi:hypothetical protein
MNANREGVVTIHFSETFIVPKNLSWINSTALEVTVISS